MQRNIDNAATQVDRETRSFPRRHSSYPQVRKLKTWRRTSAGVNDSLAGVSAEIGLQHAVESTTRLMPAQDAEVNPPWVFRGARRGSTEKACVRAQDAGAPITAKGERA